MIKVELEEKPIWKNQKISSNVNDLLLSYGFLPILFDLERENQHNCVYIKKEYISDIENLISAYFSDLSSLKLNSWEYFFHTCRDFLHSKKINNNYPLIYHFIYFLLGSKSSKYYIKEVIKSRK